METKIEYRVRPVTRYIVTRFEQEYDPTGQRASAGNSTEHGEFEGVDTAYAVGYALAKAEHDNLGWPAFDERMRYPDPTPDEKLSRAHFFRKMADEMVAMDAQERLRRERPDMLKARSGKPLPSKPGRKG